MKPVTTLIFLILFALVGCGKDNKSGKNNNGAYGLNALGTVGQYGGTSIGYNGFSVQQIVSENRCANGAPDQARVRSTVPAMVSTPPVLGDVYVGVTSFGDVAVLVGTQQGWAFESYLCPRGMMSQPQQYPPQGVTLLAYSGCRLKQMNASLPLPDGSVANFRSMQYGSSMGAPFSYCR